MKISNRFTFTSTSALRAGSCAVIASLIVPLAGCGSPAPPPTISQSQPSMSRPAMAKPGMSTKQKVVLLAGAAALYYYYRKSKAANEKQYNQKITYYRSKNGGIYYRDPTDKSVPPRPIWVQPPTQAVRPVQVPADEAQQYSNIQGYNNQTTGNGLDYYFKGQGGAESAGM